MNARARIGALLFGLAFLFGAAEAQAAAVCSNTPGVNDRVVCQVGDATVIDIDLTNPAIATAVANENAVYARHTGTGGIDVEVAGGALSATGQGGYGVFAYQRGAGGVSIVLKEGVDVTSAHHGIIGLIDNSANAAAISIYVTAGTVSATDATEGGAGVWAQHQGTGGIDIDLANVAVSTKGSGHGVYGRHTGAGGTGVDVDVKSSSISTVGDGAFGIGGAIIGNSGGAVSIDVTDVDVTTEGSISHGVYGLINNAVGEAVTVSVTRGSLSTAGRGAPGIFGHVSDSASTASLSIYTTAVTISTTARANGVYARQEGAGGIAFDLRGGSITTANDSAHAVLADNRGAGGTDIDLEGVAVSTTGDGSYGVFGYTGTGGGAIAIDVTGGRIVTAGDDSYGVIAADLNAASEAALSIYAGGVTVTTTGYASYGIYARHDGTGSLDVDLDDAAISTAGDETYGVVGNMSNAASTAAIAIDAAGDSAIAVEGLDTAGMLGLQAGLGSVGITTGAGTAIEAPFAVGMDARATNDASAAGRIVITPGGKVEALHAGVLAWAERSSGHTMGDGAQTADDAARTAPMIHVTSSGTVTVGASVTEAFIRGWTAGADETLSAAEQAVLSAITAGDSDALDTALAALPAAYDADWNAEARNFLRKSIAEPDAARAANQAAGEILGLSRAGVRAVALSHTGMATFIRQGDRDPAILAIAAASRTERQQATLAEQEKLSAAERTVLEAVLTGSGLEAALDALSGAAYTDDWKDGVRQRAASYNAGGVQVDVTGGSISAEGNGVEALYAVPHDRNGAIAVTVAEGARVTGGANGIYVRGAGAGTGSLRAQSVTVNGRVTGGTGAGVHMAGGGRLAVGKTGRVGATSGVGVLADGPGDFHATVSGTVDGDIRVDGGALTLSVPEGGVVTGDGPRPRRPADGGGQHRAPALQRRRHGDSGPDRRAHRRRGRSAAQRGRRPVDDRGGHGDGRRPGPWRRRSPGDGRRRRQRDGNGSSGGEHGAGGRRRRPGAAGPGRHGDGGRFRSRDGRGGSRHPQRDRGPDRDGGGRGHGRHPGLGQRRAGGVRGSGRPGDGDGAPGDGEHGAGGGSRRPGAAGPGRHGDGGRFRSRNGRGGSRHPQRDREPDRDGGGNGERHQRRGRPKRGGDGHGPGGRHQVRGRSGPDDPGRRGRASGSGGGSGGGEDRRNGRSADRAQRGRQEVRGWPERHE